MDKLVTYRKAIEAVLSNYVDIPYAYSLVIENETIFDYQKDRYLIMSVGWRGAKRIHGCLIHIDIIDGKVWIQRDGTEDGIAYELEAVGIPKEDIVSGFHEPAVRPYMGYGIG